MANYTPLALSAGARLGSWGLRQGKNIIEEIPQKANVLSALQVIFYSPSGEQVAALTAGYGEGALLNITWDEEKIGGLKKFSIEMLKNVEIPFFSGMLTRFFVFNVPWALGFVNKIPDTDNNNDVIAIEGIGYSEKLKDINLTKTYTNTTAGAIILDLSASFPDIDIFYNAVKIQTPLTNIVKLVLDDKSIYEILLKLVEILNLDYQNQQFIFGVDEYQEFYFKGMDKEIIQSHIFEGFNYQAPESETDTDGIVNQVKVFRTQEASEKETEFVNTFLDQDSIDNNGLFERKLTISDFVSDTEAESISDSIIQENKDPRKRVSISNYEAFSHLIFGYYALSNKRDFQRNIISEFSDLTQWTETTPASTVTINTDRVFSGRRCYKWALSSSLGDKITLDFDRIYTPKKASIYMRHSAIGTDLKITFNGKSGYILEQEVDDTGAPIITDSGAYMKVKALATTSGLTTNIKALLTNDWIRYEIEFDQLFYLDSVEIEVLTNNSVDILIDRLEIFTDSYKYNYLNLEKVKYDIGPTAIKAAADFGNKQKTMITELTEINAKNGVAGQIFSKQ